MPVPLRFERPGALLVEYRRPREGPNTYLVWVPNSSFICFTGKEVVKRTKWFKSLATGAALREWIDAIEAEEVKRNGDITVGAAA